jgi:hypothetical protein
MVEEDLCYYALGFITLLMKINQFEPLTPTKLHFLAT